MKPKRFTLFLLLTALVLFSIHSWRGLYVDEYTTWFVSQRPFDVLWQERLEKGHLPIYFVLMKYWMMFGQSEVILRLPSLLMTLGGVYCFHRTCLLLFRASTASVASGFLVLHQLTIWTAQTARPYAPLFLAVCAAVWMAVSYLQDPKPWKLVILFLSVLGGATMHVLSAVVLLIFLPMLYFERHRIARPAAIIGATLLAIVLVGSLLTSLGNEQQNMTTYRAEFQLKRGLDGLSRIAFGDYHFLVDSDVPKYFIWLLLAVLGWRAIQFWDQKRIPDSPRAAPLVIAWVLIPLIVLILLENSSKSILAHERYYVPLLPAICIWVAMGLSESDFANWRSFRRDLWVTLPAAAITFATTIAWFSEFGDGPAAAAKKLRNAKVLTEEVGPFIYEFRHGGPPVVSLHDTNEPDKIHHVMRETVEESGQFWLVFYNNKEDRLDSILRTPPEGLKPIDQFEIRHVRAKLFTANKTPS